MKFPAVSMRHKVGAVAACLVVACLFASTKVAAQTEIHRCVQEDGTIAFQERPCPDSTADAAANSDPAMPDPGSDSESADDFFDFENPFDDAEDAEVPVEVETTVPVSLDRAPCEKTTRDAIDAIDLEMRKGMTKEEGQEYLARLLELTSQLRACKQL